MSEAHSSPVLPQPEQITQREKEDAMGSYFMMFATWGLGLPLPLLNLVAAFIYFMINRKASRFVAFHSLQSLLSQIPVSLINAALLVWLVITLFADLHLPSAFIMALVFVGLVNILYIVFSIIALVKARKGQFYYLPFFGRLSFARYYGPRAVSYDRPLRPNLPPEGF